MKDQLLKMTSVENNRTISVYTFHSLCSLILRRYGSSYLNKLDPSKSLNVKFSVIDDHRSKSIIKKILKDIGNEENEEEIFGLNSDFKIRRATDINLNSHTRNDNLIEIVLEKYTSELYKLNGLDFNDLQIFLLGLLKSDERKFSHISNLYQHILIDEFQDTDALQHEIFSLIFTGRVSLIPSLHNERNKRSAPLLKFDPKKSLFVVGDPNQCIYGLRGADYQRMRGLEKDYADNFVKTYRLTENNRSSTPIVARANAVIGMDATVSVVAIENPSPVRVEKLEDEYKQAEYIAISAQKYQSQGLLVAVVCRKIKQCEEIEREMLRKGIKCIVVSSIRFYLRKEINDLLSYLKFLVNPRDELALRRIINTPPRNIGQKTVESFLRWISDNSSRNDRKGGEPNINDFLWALKYSVAAEKGLTEEMKVALHHSKFSKQLLKSCKLSQTEKSKLLNFATLITKYSLRAAEEKPSELLESMLSELKFESYLSKSDEGKEKMKNVEVLLDIARKFESGESQELKKGETVVEQFLEHTLIDAKDEVNFSRNNVNEAPEIVKPIYLMTVHQSKGTEYDSVLIPYCDDNTFPANSSADISEEKRVLYVAITRARYHLVMTWSATTKESTNELSRFIRI